MEPWLAKGVLVRTELCTSPTFGKLIRFFGVKSRPMRCAESMVVVDGLDSLESQEQARDHGQWLS